MTRTRIVPLLVVAAVALLGIACGSKGGSVLSRGPTPTPAAFPGDTWQLVYNVSGGIDGRSFGLTLKSDGAATFEDKRARKSGSKQIDAAAVKKLSDLLASSGVNSPQPTRNDGCADCIDVVVAVTTGGKTYTATTNEVNKQPRLSPLLAELSQLYNANRP
jgi:hypothetical protein